MISKDSRAVGVVIVNYKTAELTVECIRSLSHERGLNSFKVIVVDNDSQDNSYEKIAAAILAEQWEKWVQVESSGRNGGFSFGNNIAIKQFMKDENSPGFIYLLNPDTVVRPQAISQLVLFLNDNSSVGIVGSRIEDANQIPLHSSFKFHSWITELDRGFSLGILTKMLRPWISSESISSGAEKTDWVSGASMMIRSSVFDDVGLLDESYFMYYEETDFCFNAALKGWECWYVPSSRIVHFVGQSSGINNTKMKKRMPSFWFDSRRRFFLKNYGIFHAVLADLTWFTGLASWKLRNVIQKKRDYYPPFFLRDGVENSFFYWFKLSSRGKR
ncbi:MAG: glycosyl transferase family 2 [Gammaproteobacteria bacterium]|nr:MAG: glycosyl transferase family 2 [Gammaproteobacteria bacterium]